MRLVVLEGRGEPAIGELAVASMVSAQARLVVTMLAVEMPRVVRAGEIADSLWGERLPNTWETIVRVAVAKVRSWLDAAVPHARSAVQTAHGGYRLVLPPGWTIDVLIAQEAVSGAESRLADQPQLAITLAGEAVGLVADRELLPMFDSEWVQGARRSLHELSARALEVGTRAALAIGDNVRAVEFARRLTALEPLRESAHRHVMTALASSGDLAGALQTYDDLVALLQTELGLEPAAETTALRRDLLRSRTERSQPDPLTNADLGDAGFVGRQRELDRLGSAWERARDGMTTIALITGEAGIGKTTLALHVAHEAWSNGASILIGRCTPDPAMAYEPLVEAIATHVESCDDRTRRLLLADAGPALAWAVPSIAHLVDQPVATSDRDHDRLRLFESMVSFLRSVTSAGPAVLILDDVQWASEATWLLIDHLVRRLVTEPLLVVMSQRRPELASGPVERSLVGLRRRGGLVEIELGGWTSDEAATYLAGSGGPFDHRSLGSRAEQLRARTGGNPYYIAQLLRVPVADREHIHDPAHRGSIPQGILDIVRHHSTTSGPDATSLMQALAVAGSAVEPWVWRQAAELDDRPFANALDAALRTGLIRAVPDTSGRFDFVHALARDAIAFDIAAGHRQHLHLRVAQGLEQRRAAGADVSSADLARHFTAAGLLAPPDSAVKHSLDAARSELVAGAREDAAARLREVLQRTLPANVRCEVLLLLASALAQLGNGSEAHQAFLEAAALARQLDDARSLARAAIGLTSGGRGVSAWVADDARIELLRAALTAIGDGDDVLRVELLGALAAAMDGPASWQMRQRVADEAVALIEKASDPRVVLASLGATRIALWRPDQTEQRVAAAERVVAEALAIGDLEIAADAALLVIGDLVVMGDRAAVDAAFRRATDISERLGMIRHRWELEQWKAGLAMSDGRLDDATDAAAAAFAMWESEDQPDAHRAAAELRALTYLLNEDMAAIAASMPDYAQAVETNGTYRCTKAYGLALLGRDEEARALLEEISDGAYRIVPRHSSWLFSMTMLAQAAASTGPRRVIEELRDALSPHVGRMVWLQGPNVPWGMVDHHVGLLCNALGDPDAAVAHFRRALDSHRRFGATIWADRTEAALAAVLGPETG